MTYANKLRVPFVALIGEDELAQGKVSLKNMESGEQTLLTPAEAADAARRLIQEKECEKVIRG